MKKNSSVFITIIILFFGIYCIFYELTTYRLLKIKDNNDYRVIDEIKRDNDIVKVSFGKQGIYLSKNKNLPQLVANTKDVKSAKVLKYGDKGKDLIMLRENGTISYLGIANDYENKVIVADHIANLDEVTMVYNINSGISDNKYYSVIAKDKDGNAVDITEALIKISDM